MVLGVCVSVCLSDEPRLQARRISLGGEGHALYPVLPTVNFYIGPKSSSFTSTTFTDQFSATEHVRDVISRCSPSTHALSGYE